jgi:hypothetical protein
MGWFSLIPGKALFELALLAAVAALMGSAYLLQHNRIQSLKIELATEQKARSDDRAAYASAAASAAADNLTETERRLQTQARNANDAIERERVARIDASRAATAALGLRDAARAAAARCGEARSDPTALAAGPAASAPGVVLADVLRPGVGRSGGLAEALDAAYSRGQQCAADYDALSVVKP